MKLVRIVGVLAFLVVAVAIWLEVVSWKFPKGTYPGDFRKPSMALQFVATSTDLKIILGCDGQSNIGTIKELLTIDYLFIACYGLLFVAISTLLYKRNCPWARYLAIVALLAGLTAVAFDIKENFAMVRVLDCATSDQHLLNDIHNASLVKWTMSFVAIALLAIAFQDLNNRWAHWISISFIVSALAGLIALWKHPLLGIVFIPLLIGLVLLAITAFFWPRNLTERVV